MNCNSCGKELKPGAKFCGFCGSPAPAASSGNLCTKCGGILKPGAKFCGSCGTPVTAAENKAAEHADVSVMSDCIHWNILPGQIALKIDAVTLNSYGKVKGLIIQDGVKAIFFSDGKLAGELGAGKYIFNQLAPEKEIKSSFEETGLLGAASNIWRGIQRFLVGSSRTPTVMSHSELTVVLIRENEFPLVYDFADMPTAQIHSDVALQMVLKITNILEFYRTFLVDRNFISFESFAQNLKDTVQVCLNRVVTAYAPDQLSSPEAEKAVKDALSVAISGVYAFLTLDRVVRISADREELEHIRRMQEELYISELELQELTKRNHFLNKLNDANNAQALAEAQTQADFVAAMNKIDEQNLLTEDEKDKFAQTLYAQRQIREAQSEEQVEAGLAEVRKAGILREEEIEVLSSQVAHRAEMQALTDGQAIALATLQNEKILDAEKLQWELEVGTRRLDNELANQRKIDEYADERRRVEMDSQMELLRQTQSLRQEREDAEHRRDMEILQQLNANKVNEINAYAGMTAEQILVANPDISAEAAQAMAEKFKADASNDKFNMAQQMNSQMQAMMENQQRFMENQMSALRDTFSSQYQATQQAKQDELNRVYTDADKHQDRMSQVMQTTVRAVGGNGTNTEKACPKCGAKIDNGATFCSECGASL